MFLVYSKFMGLKPRSKKIKLESGMEIGWDTLGHTFSCGYIMARATPGIYCYYIFHLYYTLKIVYIKLYHLAFICYVFL